MKRASIMLVVLAAGCQPIAEGARAYVSEKYTCPLERVSARALDKKPSELRAELNPPPSPPPAVAADPARLAMWQQQQDKARQNLTSLDYNELIEVTACDAVYVLECHRRNKIRWGQSSVSCSQVTKGPLATP